MKAINWTQVIVTLSLGVALFFITKELEKRYYPKTS